PDDVDGGRLYERAAVVGDGGRDDSGAAGRRRVAYAGAVAAVGLRSVGVIRQAFGVDAVFNETATMSFLGVGCVQELRGAKQADLLKRTKEKLSDCSNKRDIMGRSLIAQARARRQE